MLPLFYFPYCKYQILQLDFTKTTSLIKTSKTRSKILFGIFITVLLYFLKIFPDFAITKM